MTSAPATHRAPAGWGYVPGAVLALEPITADALPDLPLLRLVPAARHLTVVARALADVPALPHITPTMVRAHYGLNAMACGTALDMARLRQW